MLRMGLWEIELRVCGGETYPVYCIVGTLRTRIIVHILF
jgi:hypothetical protein